MNPIERIEKCGIVQVIVLNNANNAVPLAKALLAGGIDVMEITFRTAAAKASIEAVSLEVPEMLVGAGTVLNKTQMDEAISAGAKFLVSPGSDSELIQTAAELNCIFCLELLPLAKLWLASN